MHSSFGSRTMLLACDSRQTALAAIAVAGLTQAAYSAYGQQSGTPAFRTGFNGQFREARGWYHLGNGHRVYNPLLMRFHSPDRLSPFGRGGLNAYAYCVGDPVNHTDPTGRVFEWLGGRPLHSLGLNIGLLTANLVTSVLVPAAGLALWSARLGILGATIGITGATMQLAGIEAGKPVSIVGTLTSLAGVSLRVGLGIQKLYQQRATFGADFSKGMRNLFMGPRKAPVQVAPAPVSAPGVQPTSLPASVVGAGRSSVSSSRTGTTIRAGKGGNVRPPSMVSMETPMTRESFSSVASQVPSSVPSVLLRKAERFNVLDWLQAQ